MAASISSSLACSNLPQMMNSASNACPVLNNSMFNGTLTDSIVTLPISLNGPMLGVICASATCLSALQTLYMAALPCANTSADEQNFQNSLNLINSGCVTDSNGNYCLPPVLSAISSLENNSLTIPTLQNLCSSSCYTALNNKFVDVGTSSLLQYSSAQQMLCLTNANNNDALCMDNLINQSMTMPNSASNTDAESTMCQPCVASMLQMSAKWLSSLMPSGLPDATDTAMTTYCSNATNTNTASSTDATSSPTTAFAAMPPISALISISPVNTTFAQSNPSVIDNALSSDLAATTGLPIQQVNVTSVKTSNNTLIAALNLMPQSAPQEKQALSGISQLGTTLQLQQLAAIRGLRLSDSQQLNTVAKVQNSSTVAPTRTSGTDSLVLRALTAMIASFVWIGTSWLVENVL